MRATPPASLRDPSTSGAVAAFSAYAIWGIFPVFWKALASVDSLEVLCHRIIWSFAALLPCMFFQGRMAVLTVFLRTPRNFLGLLCSGFLLAGNWYLYIWAITHDMVLEASLGYYINPLINILFGIVIFREKTDSLVWLAIGLALAGVLYQTASLGSAPLVSMGLALSFAVYGLLRKVLLIPALPGLFVETLVVLPLALGYSILQASLGNSAFFRGSPSLDILLVSAGVATTIPLLLFSYGARRITMASLGILQYISPSCILLLGVFLYGEPFTFDNFVTFACIWAALAVYTAASLRRRHKP